MSTAAKVALGLGAAYLLLAKSSPIHGLLGGVAPKGKTGPLVKQNGIFNGTYSVPYYGDVKDAERAVIAGTDDAGDVAGDVTDSETPWFALERPFEHPDVFYRQLHLPASKVSPSQLDANLWRLVAQILSAPRTFTRTIDTLGGPSSARLARAQFSAGGDAGDAALAMSIILKIANALTFGLISTAVVNPIADATTQGEADKGNVSAQNAAVANAVIKGDQGQVDALIAKQKADYAAHISSLPLAAISLVGARYQRDIVFGRESWDDPSVSGSWVGADDKLHRFLSEGDAILNNGDSEPKPFILPINAHTGVGGAQFLYRMGVIYQQGTYGIPWMCKELTEGKGTREIVNLWARLYRALDTFGCIAYPEEELVWDNARQLWYARPVDARAYSYTVGGMFLLGSVFPMPANGKAIPGHSQRTFANTTQKPSVDFIRSEADAKAAIAATQAPPSGGTTGGVFLRHFTPQK